jgi:dipeptidase D
VRLASINGGNLRNAIPREAFGVVTVPYEKADKLVGQIAGLTTIIKRELSATEPTLKIELSKIEMPATLIDEKTQINLTHAIVACPNGVIRMSDSMPGLVETSTNLAIVKSDNTTKIVEVSCLMRSSVDTARAELGSRMDSVFMLAGANIKFKGGYPGWKPNMDSPILKTMQQVYNSKFGRIPEIKAIHAGLECGILGGTYPNWDMISFGPTIRFPHSPDEKVNIESVSKFWDFLVETLKNIPAK